MSRTLAACSPERGANSRRASGRGPARYTQGVQRTIQAIIRAGDQSGYVAECPVLNAVTQGATLDEVAANLQEAVALALEGEDLEALGIAPGPVIVATFELEPAVA